MNSEVQVMREEPLADSGRLLSDQRRPVVYVAGPYKPRLPDRWAWLLRFRLVRWALRRRNVRRARAWGLMFARQGYAPLIPHTNSAGMPEDVDWYGVDLAFMRRLRGEDGDAIFLMPGWETSHGARMERAAAEQLGLLVIQWTDETPEEVAS